MADNTGLDYAPLVAHNECEAAVALRTVLGARCVANEERRKMHLMISCS